MKRFFISIFVLLFSITVFSAPVEKPLLWKAEKNGKVAYLFGTFHLGFSKADFPPKFLLYVETSQYFFMEADLSVVDQNDLLRRATFTNGQTLDMFLPEESWEKLTTQFNAVPEEKLKTVKPWFIMNSLVPQVALAQLNLQGNLDTELLQYASEKSLALGFLEDIYL